MFLKKAALYMKKAALYMATMDFVISTFFGMTDSKLSSIKKKQFGSTSNAYTIAFSKIIEDRMTNKLNQSCCY